MLTIVGAYLAALALMIAVKGVFISPDRYFVILLAPAAALGLGKRYTRDFLPLVAAILLYEQARGLAHLANPAAWYSPLIDFDSALFGGEVPSVTLQDWLWTGTLQWYDQALAVLAAHALLRAPHAALPGLAGAARPLLPRGAHARVRLVRGRARVPRLPGRAALDGLRPRLHPAPRADRLAAGRAARRSARSAP